MRDLDKIREKIVIQLDNRQVGLAILGFILVSTGTFASGVLVGQRMVDAIPERWISGEDQALEIRDGRERTAALAAVTPGTRALDSELALPPETVSASDPTEAARMEAQRQIAAARTAGTARSLGPVAVTPPEAPAATAAPLTVVDRDPRRESAALDGAATARSQYALQVSAFRSESPAEVVANQLRSAGHEVSVRQVADEDGTPLWRVEVGRFESTRTASVFQREFERSAGYPTVMVPVR